ncbi:MAG: cytochrome C biogenesis protein [Deltaproteobacteria bacterium]|nr:MAG: cytochrome C biogenesis protein [Deltaproteobacteria bacterium]
MQRLLTILSVLVVIGLGGACFAYGSAVSVEVIHSYDRYCQGKDYEIAFKVKIKKGLFLHGPAAKPGEMIIPTRLSFSPSSGATIKGLRFPKTKEVRFDYSDKPVEVYEGQVIIKATLHIGPDAGLGQHKIQGVLSYQACAQDSCLPPHRVPINVKFDVVDRDTPQRRINLAYFSTPYQVPSPKTVEVRGFKPHGALWLTLLGLFFGGLALNLTPCIYPLIPITVSFFGARSQKLKGKRFIHGALYMAGLSITNSTLGVSAALTGGMLGAALQNPIVLIVVSVIILAMGLSFFGLWEIRLPGGIVNLASRGFGGFFGSFFMGLTLGVVAAPCLGPFVLGLLTYVGQKGDAFIGFLYFFVLSIGLGLPLCFLAIFSGAVDRLPMSGNWLVWIKKCFGWVLVAMAVFMIRPLIPIQFLKTLAIPAVLMAAAIHVGFLDRTSANSRHFRFVKTLLGAVVLATALVTAYASWHAEEGIKWIPYRQGLLQEAKAERKPVIIDFYADWCGPCREMDKTTFRDQRVKALIGKFFPIRVDLTKQSPETKKLVQRFNVRGVPTVVFLRPDGTEVSSLRIQAYAPPYTFASKMAEVLTLPPRAKGT